MKPTVRWPPRLLGALTLIAGIIGCEATQLAPAGAPKIDLSIAGTVDQDSATVGSPVTFTLTVRNLGPVAGTAVVAGDTLPAGLTYSSHTASDAATYTPTTGVWNIGALAVSGLRTLTLTANVAAGTAVGTLLTNRAGVISTAESDSALTNNVATNTVKVVAPPSAPKIDLSIADLRDRDSTAEGGSVTFTATVRNLGPVAATNVTAIDTMPAGLTYTSHTASTGTTYTPATHAWAIGALPVNSPRTLAITATANTGTGGSYRRHAVSVAATEADSVPGNNLARDSVRITAPPPPPPPGTTEPVPPATELLIQNFRAGNLAGGTSYLSETFDRYTTTVSDMLQVSNGPYGNFNAGPAWTAASNATGKSLIPGRIGGVAIRSLFDPAIGNRPLWQTPWINGYLGAYTGTIVIQVWFRFPNASGFYDATGGKFFEMWYATGALGRIQFGMHGTFHFNPGFTAGSGPSELGYQPIGPYPASLNDGQWHRMTIAYRPHTTAASGWNGSSYTTPSSRDGFARGWLDGTKISDVSSTVAGTTPSSGTKVWCTLPEVDALGAGSGANIIWLQFPEFANGITAPFNLDHDDLKVWAIP